ncbi:DUF1330 domain-containing protein [Teredinibacter turnerae]|uniref:DUF1330 domain-containing protein n=1 Tax=Teredinibacter turnerae TaxID=2426 RepID=UPI0003733855|nr:DUF1330 domain-containing protein [Teredinibacter turnerae]
MSAYIIVDIAIKNETEYKKYITAITPSVTQYGGRYLVRGGNPETLDGSWQSSRMVVMEYPDRATAVAWLEAAELSSIHQMRRDNAHFCNMIVCDGVPV